MDYGLNIKKRCLMVGLIEGPKESSLSNKLAARFIVRINRLKRILITPGWVERPRPFDTSQTQAPLPPGKLK